jgi:hypothetical protein
MPKIMVGIPSGDMVHTMFAHDLAVMIGKASCIPSLQIGVFTISGTILHESRNDIAKQLLDSTFDHLLFLDTDMRFPPHALGQLLDHDLPIVAANYTTRRAPYRPVSMRHIGTNEPLYTDADSTGLEECAACGMGFALIKREVFEKTEKPWFLTPYIPRVDGSWGEDVWFCNQVRKAGFPVMLDHDLSKEIRHIGLREFSFQDAADVKDEALADWRAECDRKQAEWEKHQAEKVKQDGTKHVLRA